MLCACTNTNSLSKGFSIDDINNIIVTHKTDIDEKLSELHSSGKLLDVILWDSSTVTPDDTYNDHKEDIDTVIANHNRIVSLLNEILNNNPQKTDNKVNENNFRLLFNNKENKKLVYLYSDGIIKIIENDVKTVYTVDSDSLNKSIKEIEDLLSNHWRIVNEIHKD